MEEVSNNLKGETGAKQEESQSQEKLPYEQLEGIAHQLSNKVRELMTQREEYNREFVFKRLEYLFKVINVSSRDVFSDKFITDCAEEIQNIMNPLEDDLEETPNN